MTVENDHLPTDSKHPIAGAICLLGCFMYMALPEPLLNALGFHYSDGGGFSFQKIHPAAVPVFISFIALLIGRGNALRNAFKIWRAFPATVSLLALTTIIFLYAALRSGTHGLGFLLDTHLVVPIIALVVACAPFAMTRKAELFFIGFAALDALVGIGEFCTHHRLYSFDPAWSVLHEEHFRASALMGQPVASSLFLPVALFAAISLDLPRIIKTGLIILLPIGLVAFGAYLALLVTLCGLGVVGAGELRREIVAGRLTVARAWVLSALVLCGLAVFAAQVFCSADERMAAAAEYHYLIDSQSRAFAILPLLNLHEFVAGVSANRISQLAASVGIDMARSDIDDPWVLMLLIMGGGFFLLWTAATACFLRVLTRRGGLALTCAILAYFIIATTSNSLGRKDVIYPAMICLVACAAYRQDAKKQAATQLKG